MPRRFYNRILIDSEIFHCLQYVADYCYRFIPIFISSNSNVIIIIIFWGKKTYCLTADTALKFL
jgi:hypothetical protein